MKIALIARRLNVRGGTQRMIVCLASELARRNHVVTLYTFTYDREECYPEILGNLTVIEVDSPVKEALANLEGARGIFGLIRTYYTQNRAARNLAHKISSDTEVLNPHDGMAERVSAYFKREMKNIPSVWMLNDVGTKQVALLKRKQLDPSYNITLFKKIAFWLIDLYEYVWFVRSQEIIAVLDSRDQRWARQGFHGKEAVIVRNGLDIKEFPFTEHRGMQQKKVQLLAVAILLPHRRFEDAIRATGILRSRGFDARLSIIGKEGDAKYAKTLQLTVAESQLSNHVSFRGVVTQADLLRAYRESDVFLFPCHLQSWGLAVFEAMASGLPVIVSDTAGASEVLTDRENALVVPPCSPEKIAEAVEKLADEKFYQKISKNGRTFVETKISWSRYADQLLALFSKAVTSARS